MSNKIGFIILSYIDPQQVLRLVRSLQRVYDNPPIVCHHNFSQSELSPDVFPTGVRFVLPHVNTRWGHFSVVTAMLRALELLYSEAVPDWFFLLSGTDYPVMESGRVLEELTASGIDAFLDFREVTKNLPDLHPGTTKNPALQLFDLPRNVKMAWGRYMSSNLWIPIIRSGPRIGRYTAFLPFESWRSPFGSQFKCFYGDHWFAGNKTTADVLLHPTDKHLQLRRHLRWRSVPEECYYHTVLANTVRLKISTATRRFCKWSHGAAHPEFLGMEDLEEIISSNSYFARKFSPNSPALDEIDRMLL
jgi:hypothetical protein